VQAEHVAEGVLDRAEPQVVHARREVEQCPPPACVPLDDRLWHQQVGDVADVACTRCADHLIAEVCDGGPVARGQFDVVERDGHRAAAGRRRQPIDPRPVVNRDLDAQGDLVLVGRDHVGVGPLASGVASRRAQARRRGASGQRCIVHRRAGRITDALRDTTAAGRQGHVRHRCRAGT
jgi:hypothetical protein